MHARISTNEDMLGHFWVMATTRAESIVPFSPKAHHMPNGRAAKDKLRKPQLV